MTKKSWIEDTYIGELIDRCVENWAILLGFAEGERTRSEDGTFVGDDPSTPEINEAWKTGKKPRKKTRKTKNGDA